MDTNIFTQIINEISEFVDTNIPIVSGYSFNQYETIQRIHRHLNNRFEDSEYDSEGFQKFFYNLSEYRCDVATKAIDLDTRDINVIAEQGQSYYPCWYFEKELRQWIKEKGFGKLINRIVWELPRYGSVVVKDVDTPRAEKMIVDLRNFFIDQATDSLDTARFIIERHYYTPEELRKMPWNKDAIEEAIEKFRDNTLESYYGASSEESVSTPFIEVWERYGEWENEDGKYTKRRFIVAGLREKTSIAGKRKMIDSGVILNEEEINDIPYREVHWERVRGRWLGKGFVEKLFEVQVRVNEVVNLQAKGLWWTALHLFQTRDETINRNLLSDVVNGEIITAASEIMPIVNEERNLQSYQTEMDRWERQADNLAFTYAPITGERLPAGTPLGSAMIQTEMAQGFFDLKREAVGMFLKDIIFDLIIPRFKKAKSKEHILNLVGESPEELSKFEQLKFNYEYNQRILKWIKDNETIPTQREAQVLEMTLRERLKEPTEKFAEIPARFYDTLKYKIDIVITGEAIDVASKLNTLQVAIQLLASNPAIIKDEQIKRIFYKLLDLAGINPADFEVTGEQPSLEEEIGRTLPTGGSIRVPRAPATPAILPEATTV